MAKTTGGMTQTDYEIVGSALRDLPLPLRMKIYRRLVASFSVRYDQFDPEKFGVVMIIPPLFRSIKKEVS